MFNLELDIENPILQWMVKLDDRDVFVISPRDLNELSNRRRKSATSRLGCATFQLRSSHGTAPSTSVCHLQFSSIQHFTCLHLQLKTWRDDVLVG